MQHKQWSRWSVQNPILGLPVAEVSRRRVRPGPWAQEARGPPRIGSPCQCWTAGTCGRIFLTFLINQSVFTSKLISRNLNA